MLPPNTTDRDLLALGRRYDVNGRRLVLYRAGTGAPAVVFLAGGGTVGLDYLNLHTAAATLTTSVLYDRGGTGWSDPVELPRTATEVTDELSALLTAAGISPPYVFVGHSLGGLYARRYAQRWPAEVGGLLLLDPAHEDFNANLSERARQLADQWKDAPMPEVSPELAEAFRPFVEKMLAGWPAEVRGPLIAHHMDPVHVSTGLKETRNVDALYDEMRQGGATPPVPIIVFTATGIDDSQRMFSPEEIIHDHNAAKLLTNAAFARSVPGAEHRVLDDASHVLIHVQREDACVQALRDLLARVKT